MFTTDRVGVYRMAIQKEIETNDPPIKRSPQEFVVLTRWFMAQQKLKWTTELNEASMLSEGNTYEDKSETATTSTLTRHVMQTTDIIPTVITETEDTLKSKLVFFSSLYT